MSKSEDKKFNRGSWLVTIPMVAIAVVQITFVYFPGRRAVAELRKDIEHKQRVISDAAHVPATGRRSIRIIFG